MAKTHAALALPKLVERLYSRKSRATIRSQRDDVATVSASQYLVAVVTGRAAVAGNSGERLPA